ncbi:cytidine deaminase-like protein [Lentinula lateritia]|uniref:dCMP deaminase n=1 Tax=Lentinula lateritia TaxID=40482 RepID=A0ABQ8VBB5_9AGAR|nr:cytidine deaminase-like protein [Lentinula lateritia]
MFIAIIGTRSSGCSTVEEFLISSQGFTSIRLDLPDEVSRSICQNYLQSRYYPSSSFDYQRNVEKDHSVNNAAKHLSFLTFDATPLPSPSPISDENLAETNDTVSSITFRDPTEVLDYVTRNWRSNFVTTDLRTREVIEMFIKRPFFMLLSLDGPLLERYRRSNRYGFSSQSTRIPSFLQYSSISLQAFAAEDDQQRFGKRGSSLNGMADLVNVRVVNDFASVPALYAHIESLDLFNPLHLRPDWDMYFMTLASLASQRSNCMKRRVGAILVRDKRIVSTGYNGTPRGVRNCNEGGCIRCNSGSEAIGDNEECVCLHAEENALLEAGRDRVGKGTLYCNTCPCLKCTIKIIQTGVECVVYNLSYKVDTASAKLFAEAGVKLRRFDPAQHRLSTFPPDGNYDTSTIDMTSDDESSMTG